MRPPLLIGSTLLCSAFTAGIVSAFVQRPPATSAPAASPEPRPSDVEVAQEPAWRNEIASLQMELDAVRAELRRAASTGSRVALTQDVSTGEVESAVRRLVAEEALREAEDAALAWPGGALDAADAYARIRELDREDAAALWSEAAENGQLHAVLEAMEAWLATQPESAENEFLRATSYYSAARAFPGNQDGNWWVDSNDAFTRALELDPEHWGARYEKARNMAFWPPAYGGQAEAARHFEILAEQQERRPQEARFADTYLWLGNLYDQQGRAQLAREAWERGLALFPDEARFVQKLATLGGR